MTPSAFPQFLDELEARTRITDGLLRYTRGVDRHDWELLRSAYHDDAQISHGTFVGGPDGMVSHIRDRHQNVEYISHHVSNITIEFVTTDRAVVEAYGIASQRATVDAPTVPPGARGLRTVFYFRYVDTFERRDGDWRIARALLILGDTAQEPLAEGFSGFGDQPTSEMGGGDPMYFVRQTEGLK